MSIRQHKQRYTNAIVKTWRVRLVCGGYEEESEDIKGVLRKGKQFLLN